MQSAFPQPGCQRRAALFPALFPPQAPPACSRRCTAATCFRCAPCVWGWVAERPACATGGAARAASAQRLEARDQAVQACIQRPSLNPLSSSPACLDRSTRWASAPSWQAPRRTPSWASRCAGWCPPRICKASSVHQPPSPCAWHAAHSEPTFHLSLAPALQAGPRCGDAGTRFSTSSSGDLPSGKVTPKLPMEV